MVEDQERALVFYTKVLGFRKMADIPMGEYRWLTVTSISRDILIALSALIINLQTGHSSFPPSLLGKCTTAAQLMTVGFCMLANFVPWVTVVLFMPSVYITLFFTVASGLHYFYRSVRIIERYQKADGLNGKKRDQNP
jgi:phosphatidylglycerophosphate synthase